jgi:protein gp37
MAKNTSIEWTDHTWNPWVGCRKVSPGCKNCYMFRDQEHWGNDPTKIRRTTKSTFYSPMGWKKPAMVFTCSWSDFFLEEADEWREDAWIVIRHTPHLTYQILTKRPERIQDCIPEDWGKYGYENVWLGVSVENQEYDYRIGILSKTPARVWFVSYEPATGPLELEDHMSVGFVDWVISGGESGYNSGKYKARPAEMDWFRDIRDECIRWDIPYFHKQNGGTMKGDGAWGGREIDGRTWDQFPVPFKERTT